MKEETKMKKLLIRALVLIVSLGLLSTASCKKSQNATEYSLSVVLSTGVTGTPEGGNYVYNLNDQVNYSYEPDDGYTHLRVTLDGQQVESSGTITMDRDHTLTVTAAQGSGEFLLYITYGEGVTGTPEEGYYYHNAGDQVDYDISLEDGYTNLSVTLDGNEVESSGTITISGDHTLNAYASLEYYIQGSWTLSEVYDDGSAFTVTVTFSGETENGTVIDSDGGVGTYTVSGSAVDFTLGFPEVTYEYSGTFTSEESMGGSARRYISPTVYKSGSWTAQLITTTTAKSQSVTSNKGKK
jgi:hypothetical protein